MLVALLTTLFALVTVCSTQITIVPLSNNASVTVSSCSVAYYQWSVPASPQGWYLKIVLNQNASAFPTEALSMYLLDRVPDGTPPNSTACTDLGSRCTAQAPLYTCTITRACGDLSGNYYIAVESTGSSQSFSVAASVVQLPTVNALTIFNTQSGRPTFVTGGTLLTTDDRFDYFSLDVSGIASSITDGTRLVVSFSSSVKWYLKYGTSPALSPSYTSFRLPCYHSTGTSASIELEACVVRQGGSWSIAVERTIDAFTYSALAYTSAPKIVDYPTLGSEVFLSLAVASDNVYLKIPAGAVAIGTRLVAAVDNVAGGRVQLTTSYKKLDATGGCATDNFVVKTCSSHAGCFTEHLPCEVTQATDPWYISIKALSIQSADTPVSFTASVFTTPIQATQIGYGQEYVGRAKYSRTQHFTLPAATGNQFVYIRVYTDASLSTSDLNLYVGSTYTGSGSCYSYTKRCTAARNSILSASSCSIQLDPCELANFPNGIFVGVEGDISRTDFYYFQENGVPFTLSAEIVDPNAQPNVIDPNDLIQGHVANNQIRMYRVGEWDGTMSVTLTAGTANQAQTPQSFALSLQVFFGNPQGPSCPCWSATTSTNVGGTNTQSTTYSLGRCDSRVAQGIYVVVAGNRAYFSSAYYYEETEFTLSFVASTTVVDTVGPVKISPGKTAKSHLNDKDNLLIYELTVPSRTNLLSTMIYTRWETQACASVSASLGYAAAGTSGPLSCNAPTYGFGSDSLDGEYYNAVGGCQIFTSDTDGRRLLARMQYSGVNCGSLSSTLGVPVSFYYFFDRNVPTQITADGSPYVGTLPVGVYQHFNVGVSNADALKKSLVIEVYFDAGITSARPPNGVTFYLNTPKTDKPAGEPGDCMCYEQVRTGVKTKLTYFINPCELKAGNYHFSLREQGFVTAYFPVKYTLKVTLVDPVVTTLTQNFPYDDKQFSGVPKYYQVTIPPAFVGTDETNTDRELLVRVITEDSSTTLTVQLAQTQGVVCGCDGDATSYQFNSFANTCNYDPNGRYVCTHRFGHCQLTAGTWYLRVLAGSSRSDEVPYTVFVSTRNNHPLNSQTLTASSTCLLADRDPVKVVSVVDDANYQHFKVSATGSQSTLYVYLENLVGGTADVFISDTLLATEACNNASVSCTTSPCITSAACGNAVKYISVRGNSIGADPVSFTISTCVVPGSLVLGTPQPGISINNGETVSRSFSLASLPAGNTPALFASLDFGSTSASGQLSILRSSCASCPSTITPFTTTCSGTTCSLRAEPCQVPQDYNTGLWLVTFTSTSGISLTFSLVVGAPTLPPTPTTITPISGVSTPIPAGTYGLFGYTVSAPFDPVTVTSLSVSSSGSSVYFTFGTSLAGLGCFQTSGFFTTFTSRNIGPVPGSCCTPPGQYLVAVFNPSTTPQTITITPNVVNRTTYLQEGDYPLTTTLSVSLSARSTAQLVRVKSFPGFYGLNLGDHFAFVLTPTASPLQSIGVYLGRTALTGQAVCSDFFSLAQTTINTGSTNPTYIVPPEIDDQCDNDVSPVIAGDYYLAFYNNQIGATTVGVDITVVKASVNTLTIGTPFSAAISYSGERHIYRIPIATNILTSLTIDIQNATFNGNVVVSPDVRRVGNNCNNFNTVVGSFFVSPQPIQCSNLLGSSGTVALAIQAGGIGGTAYYSINATVNTIPSTTVTSGTPYSATLLGGIPVFYTYTTPSTLTTGSYVSLVLSNITTSGTISVYPDEQCSGMTVITDCSSGVSCSAFIFPCDLKPSTTYYIRISTPSDSTPVFTVTLSTKAHTILGRNAQLSDSVNPYALNIYEIPLTAAESGTGASLSIVASGVSCGNVRISTSAANQYSCASTPSSFTLMTPATGATGISNSVNFCGLGTAGHSIFVMVRGVYSLVSASTPIRFKLQTTSESSATVRGLQPEETGIVNYVASSTTSSCVAQTAIPGAPKCCPSTTSASSGTLEKVWWSYSFEGSQFLDFQNVISFSTYGYVSSFTYYTSYNSACQATASSTNCPGGFCSFTVAPCNFWPASTTENRELFIYIDPASVTYYATPTFGTNSTSAPVIQIRNTRKRQQIISLSLTAPTYYLVTLANQETEFVRIPKPAALANFDGRVSVDVVAVTNGGALSVLNSWDICSGVSTLCSAGSCDDRLAASGGCTNSVGVCTCTDYLQSCDPRFAQGSDLFYQLKATVVSGGITLVKALISVTLTAQSSVMDSTKCYDFPTTIGDFQFYTHNLPNPTAEQVYNFILNDQTPASSSSLALRLGKGSLPGTTCATYSTSASGTNFRFLPTGGQESPMYLSVYNTFASTRYYKLDRSLVTVPVKTLSSGVEMSSPSTNENPGCSSTTYNNYYKFTATGNVNGYLLVEFFSTSTVSVYAGKGQVFTETTGLSCTSFGTSCYFVIGCSSSSNLDYSAGVYYFYVPSNSVHRIKVTEGTATIVQHTAGTPLPVQIPAVGAITTVQVTPPAGEAQTRFNLDTIFPSQSTPVFWWTNRGKFGDNRCSIDLGTSFSTGGSGTSASQCLVSTTDTLFISFLGTSSMSCVSGTRNTFTVNLRSSTVVGGAIYTTVAADSSVTPQPIAAGKTYRETRTVSGLDDDTALFVRLVAPEQNGISVTVSKGSHSKTDSNYPLPCAGSCAVTTSSGVTFQDKCWHCGNNTYSNFVADISTPNPFSGAPDAKYSLFMTAKKYTPLTATAQTATLGAVFTDAALFSTTVTTGRIELRITSGQYVNVRVFPDDCALRSTQIMMNCYPGGPCIIPIPNMENTGSQQRSSGRPSVLSTNKKVLIVVVGTDSTFTIAHYTGTAMCSQVESGFCFGVVPNGFGTTESMSQKDNYAQTLYSSIVNSFSCPASSCNCKPPSAQCTAAIKQLVCSDVYRPCATVGGATVGQSSTYSQCTTVQAACGFKFSDVGLPLYDCEHNGIAGVKVTSDATGVVTVLPPPVAGIQVFASSHVISVSLFVLVSAIISFLL